MSSVDTFELSMYYIILYIEFDCGNKFEGMHSERLFRASISRPCQHGDGMFKWPDGRSLGCLDWAKSRSTSCAYNVCHQFNPSQGTRTS